MASKTKLWPWILGGAAVLGGALLLGRKKAAQKQSTQADITEGGFGQGIIGEGERRIILPAAKMSTLTIKTHFKLRWDNNWDPEMADLFKDQPADALDSREITVTGPQWVNTLNWFSKNFTVTKDQAWLKENLAGDFMRKSYQRVNIVPDMIVTGAKPFVPHKTYIDIGKAQNTYKYSFASDRYWVPWLEPSISGQEGKIYYQELTGSNITSIASSTEGLYIWDYSNDPMWIKPFGIKTWMCHKYTPRKPGANATLDIYFEALIMPIYKMEQSGWDEFLQDLSDVLVDFSNWIFDDELGISFLRQDYADRKWATTKSNTVTKWYFCKAHSHHWYDDVPCDKKRAEMMDWLC